MTSYLIYNRRANRQWKASAEEAMLYCSKLNALSPSYYLVIDLNTGNAMDPIEVLVTLFNTRRIQREKKNV